MVTKADTPAGAPADDVITNIDDFVRFRDLGDLATNSNVPRSILRQPLEAIDGDAEGGYVSAVDRTHAPGEGFKEKSIKAQAVQMKVAFDANGQAGNAGDWLVNVDGHWFVAKEL